MGRPDLTVRTLWTIPLIYNLVLIAHAQLPLISAHDYVSKVRFQWDTLTVKTQARLCCLLLSFEAPIDVLSVV